MSSNNQKQVRGGWSDAFAQMHERGEDELLVKNEQEVTKIPKPIFVVRVPVCLIEEREDAEQSILDLINGIGGDYYVLVTTEKDLSSIQFEMFSVCGASIVNFEQFQWEVNKKFEEVMSKTEKPI